MGSLAQFFLIVYALKQYIYVQKAIYSTLSIAVTQYSVLQYLNLLQTLHFSRFSRNSETFGPVFLTNLEEMFSRYCY